MNEQEKREKVIKGLECCLGKGQKRGMCEDCPYDSNTGRMKCNLGDMHVDALVLLKANKEEIMALRRLVEWAEECGFGLDNIYWKEYVKPEELEGMAYIEQLIYIAKKAVKKDE